MPAKQTRQEMLAEAKAMQRKLLEADPDGYPIVHPPQPPLWPDRGGNCVVCVHSRRKRDDGEAEVLVEWSSPPYPEPRLSWIPQQHAVRIAPSEVDLFEMRDRVTEISNARDRFHQGKNSIGGSAAATDDLADMSDEESSEDDDNDASWVGEDDEEEDGGSELQQDGSEAEILRSDCSVPSESGRSQREQESLREQESVRRHDSPGWVVVMPDVRKDK